MTRKGALPLTTRRSSAVSRFGLVLLVMLACAGVSLGQTLSPFEIPPEVAWVEEGVPCFWAGCDYLLWWIKRPAEPIPLVTTGDPKSPIPGAFGQPGTMVLVG